MKRAAWVVLTVSFVSGAAAFAQYAPQQAGTQPLEPELEARVQALGKQLRCVVCQGMSIADSPASMARAQMDVVRTLVKEGKSDDEIRQYFVARYGEFALLKPSAETNLFVWIAPGAFFAVGLVMVVWYAFRHSSRAKRAADGAQPAATTPMTASATAEDPYLSAVRAELEQ